MIYNYYLTPNTKLFGYAFGPLLHESAVVYGTFYGFWLEDPVFSLQSTLIDPEEPWATLLKICVLRVR